MLLSGFCFYYLAYQIVPMEIKEKSIRRRDMEIGGVSLLSWLLLFVLALTWGSSYLLIKKGLVSFTPQQVACVRMSITSLCFLPFFLLYRKKVDWSKWKYLAVVGFVGSFFPALLFATAQTNISSSLTGVLSSFTPLATLVLGILFFRVGFSWMKIIGVLIGLAGTVWLLLIGREGGRWAWFGFGMLVVLACLFYGISTNVIKKHLQDIRSLTISAVSYSMVGIPALTYLAFSGFAGVFEKDEKAWTSLGYLSLLAVFGTVMGSLFYFELIKKTNALFASTVSYLTPMVAVLLGALDGETITVLHLAGMLMILVGVYVARQ